MCCATSCPRVMAKVAAHDHVWYAIVWKLDGTPALWACGYVWGCIKTVGLKRTGRKGKYQYMEPENQEAEPTTGLWDPDVLGFGRELQDLRSSTKE